MIILNVKLRRGAGWYGDDLTEDFTCTVTGLEDGVPLEKKYKATEFELPPERIARILETITEEFKGHLAGSITILPTQPKPPEEEASPTLEDPMTLTQVVVGPIIGDDKPF